MRMGILSKLLHRRLWNILLLITFLVTAMLGLLLTIQINYKLEWTFVNTILKYHVDFGIGMSFIAVFHLAWHWNFYKSIFKKRTKGKRDVEFSAAIEYSGKPVSSYLIIFSGFLSMIIQVLLLREITTVFQGNEILMVWTLGVWMLLNGAGVWIGSRLASMPSADTITKIIIIYSIIPILYVPLLNILRNIIFPPGVMVSPLSFFLVVIFMLFPVCLLAGLTFAFLIKSVQKTGNGFIRVYALEAVGCMIGGLVSSFLLLYWLSITQSLLLIAVFFLLCLYVLNKKWGYLPGALLLLLLLISTFYFHTNNLIKSELFVNQKILESKETYFGNVTVTEKAGQYNFFENGTLLFTSQNNIISEEYVHYAMLQRKHPGDVLLVSGGISGMLDELIKYPELQSVEYIELNPELVRIAEKYFPLPDDKRIHVIFNDVKKYLRKSTSGFDVAIIGLPDPSSLQINRMFTSEFMQMLHRHLKPGGVVIYGLSSSGNYLSDIQINTSALMYNTLQKNFRNVLIIPGERDYYLASDSALSPVISELWTKNPVDNIYVNAYYIDDYSIRERSKYILEEIEPVSLINTDDKPLPVFYNVLNYLSHFNISGGALGILLLILLLFPLLFLRPLTTGVYLAGFSGAASELLVIFVFQIVYGFVYSAIGLIIAFFMCGLAMGSILAGTIKINTSYFRIAQIVLVLYFLVFPLLISYNPDTKAIITWLLFFLLILIPSAIIGYVYAAATHLTPEHISRAASSMYAVDLLGAAFGVVAISMLLVPVLGITVTCFIIAGMNGIGIFIGLVNKKGYYKQENSF